MDKTIELCCDDSQMVNEAIDRILVKVHSHKKKTGGNTFLLSGCGKEAGTTTICVNLAAALALSGWNVLLVDCDLRKKKEQKRFGQGDEKGLADFFDGNIEKKNIIYKTNYQKLSCIPAGKVCANPVRLLCTEKMEKFMEEIKSSYDYIIYDVPSLNIVSDANILFPYVDGIALVVGLRKNTKRQVRDARRRVVENGEKYLGMIMNYVELPQYKKYIKDFDYFNKEDKQAKHDTKKDTKKRRGK